MRPSASPLSFYKENDQEIRCMVGSLCTSMNYQGSIEDLVQDVYVRMITKNVLAQYDPTISKISTYIFTIIKNLVLGQIIKEGRHRSIHIPSDSIPDDMIDNVDAVIQSEHVDPDYVSMIQRNQDSDETQGLLAELHDFEENYLSGDRDKKFNLKRRKNRKVRTRGCRLSDLLNKIYKGYSNHEIAVKYGVTDMSVTHIKHQLAKTMLRYGLNWRSSL